MPVHRSTSNTAGQQTLAGAFQLQPGDLVAFVGGGGKTSLLFALARELAQAGQRVVATTTTHMATTEVTAAPAYCRLESLESLSGLLEEHGFCLVVGSLGLEKASGVSIEQPAQLLARDDVEVVLVEADGAKRLPVKAPDEHEPAIPAGTTLLVPVAGIDALEGPIADVAHRPHLVAALLGRSLDDHLTPEDVATLLTHEAGGLKNAPPTARVIPFVNKVETDVQLERAVRIAGQAARNPRIQRVLVGAAGTAQPLRLIVDSQGDWEENVAP